MQVQRRSRCEACLLLVWHSLWSLCAVRRTQELHSMNQVSDVLRDQPGLPFRASCCCPEASAHAPAPVVPFAQHPLP